MILIIIKFCELLLRISPRIINSLISYIKLSKECFLLFPNTEKLVKRTRLRLVFPTYMYFSVFGNRRKHSSSCLIYYMKDATTANQMYEFGTRNPQSHTRKTGLPGQKFRTTRNDSTRTTQEDVFHLYPNRNFREFLVNGKRPL